MSLRGPLRVLRRLFTMFAAGWLITLGVAVALLAAWLVLPRAASVIGFAAAALVAVLLLADVTLTARRPN